MNSEHWLDLSSLIYSLSKAFSSLEADILSLSSLQKQNSEAPFDVDSKMKIDATAVVEIVQQSSGVLSEHDRNDLSLYSSDEIGFRDRVLGSSVITPRSMNNRNSEIAPNQSIPSKPSSENQRSRFSSPCVRAKEHEDLTVSVTRAKAPEETSGDQSKNDGEFETSSIFGGTPFRKGFESPSAWKYQKVWPPVQRQQVGYFDLFPSLGFILMLNLENFGF